MTIKQKFMSFVYDVTLVLKAAMYMVYYPGNNLQYVLEGNEKIHYLKWPILECLSLWRYNITDVQIDNEVYRYTLSKNPINVVTISVNGVKENIVLD